MRKILFILALTILYSVYISTSAHAENGDWRIYASYYNAKKAIKVGTRYFVLANGNIYIYDTEDSSLGVYDKTNALSDFNIYDIAYCKNTNSIFILYQNGNIDIMNLRGGCYNLPDLKNKALGDKTLNEVNITGANAYISTNSGVVNVDIKNHYFKSFYSFSKQIKRTLASSTKLYAITNDEVYVGNLSDNLLDAEKWLKMSKEEINSDVEYSQLANENINDTTALKAVSGIIPDSPVRNNSYRLCMIGERLLVAGGTFNYPQDNIPGTAMKYENNRWTNFDEKAVIDSVGSRLYMNVTDIVQDPDNPEHHWLGTMTSGIYEFRNYKYVKNHTYTNSPLKDIRGYGQYYVRVTALQFDGNSNLWMCNNECDTIVRIRKKNGTWVSYYYNEIENYPTFDNIMFDSRGWAWITHRRTTNSGSNSGVLVIDTNGTIDNQNDDRHKFISVFTNQDGVSYNPDLCYSVREDINGDIWIGTSDGVFVTDNPKKIFDSNFSFSQIKVSRNDGSGLADYLLSGVNVKCIAIDGGNRKWIGTINNGVYLISADGTETIEHFTKDNSPLISDNIYDIAINGVSGEVFIATDKGLCSYMGDATDASESMDDNTLKVFPNPIRPEYSGEVHITGLMFDSDVKIVNAAGKLIYEGKSIGGEFSWNCCNINGHKCASGIYYALCTDENGKKGACTKILIIK